MTRDIYSINEEYHDRVVRMLRERERKEKEEWRKDFVVYERRDDIDNDGRYEAYERMAKVENDRIAQGGHEWLTL